MVNDSQNRHFTFNLDEKSNLPKVKSSSLYTSGVQYVTRRPAPAYFSPNYKSFDQLLQTVKYETTVLNLVFKGILQTSIPPLISIFNAQEGYHDLPLKTFCPRAPKKIADEPLCFRILRVSKNVKKGGGWYHDFPSKLFCLTVPKNFVGEPFLASEKFWYRIFFMHKWGGGGGGITIFRRND